MPKSRKPVSDSQYDEYARISASSRNAFTRWARLHWAQFRGERSSSTEPRLYKRLGFWVIVAFFAAIAIGTGFSNYIRILNGGVWGWIVWLAFLAFFAYWGFGALRRAFENDEKKFKKPAKANPSEAEAAEQPTPPEESAEAPAEEAVVADDSPTEVVEIPPPDTPERGKAMSNTDMSTWLKRSALGVSAAIVLAVVIWGVLALPSPADWITLVVLAALAVASGVFVWLHRRTVPAHRPVGKAKAKTKAKRRPAWTTPRISSPTKKWSAAMFLVVVVTAILSIAAAKSIAPSGQVVTETASVSQEQFSNMETKLNDLQTQLNNANDKLAVQQTVTPVDNVKKKLSEGESAVLSALEAQNIGSNTVRFNSDINIDWAKQVSPGGTTFGDAIYTPADAVKFLKSGTPEAKAALASLRDNTKASDAELQNASNWTEVQYTTPIQWNGNTFYVNGRAVDGGSKVDPAGSVGIYYTGPQTIKLLSSDGKLAPENLYGFRGACANPQLAPVTPAPPAAPAKPQGGGYYVPPMKYVPTPPPPPVCVENCHPTPPPPPCTENCHPNPPCVDNPNTPEDECNPLPPCEENCNPNPPCEENCNPNPPCVDNPNTPEDECNPTPPCEEECTPNPPEKCDDQGDKEFCGTPDTGGEQQPVQDNDPELIAPTPGYEEGSTEETLGNQDHCTTECGLDPTEDGTIVDGSENGGGAPGGHVEEPIVDNTTGSGGDNPNHDGTDHSTNPDLGTAAPEDSTTSEETVDSSDSDWNSGFELPGINSGAQDNSSSIVEQDAPVTEMTTPSYTEQSTQEYTAPAVTQDYSYTAPTTTYSEPSTTDSSYDAPVTVDSSANSASSYSSDNTNVSSYTADTTVSTSNTTAVDTGSTTVMEVD